MIIAIIVITIFLAILAWLHDGLESRVTTLEKRLEGVKESHVKRD